MKNITAGELLAYLRRVLSRAFVATQSEIVTSLGVVSNFSPVDGFVVAKTDGGIMSVGEAIDRLKEFDGLLLQDPVIIDGLFVRKMVATDGNVVLIHEDDAEGQDERGKPPKSMTANNLLHYLTTTINRYPEVTDQFVMVDGKTLKPSLNGRRVSLQIFSPGVTKDSHTALSLIRYLQMATAKGGIFAPVGDNPVVYGYEEIVNATVVDGHVVLQTFAHYLEYQKEYREGTQQPPELFDSVDLYHALMDIPATGKIYPILLRDEVVTKATITNGYLVLTTEPPSTKTEFLTPILFRTFMDTYHNPSNPLPVINNRSVRVFGASVNVNGRLIMEFDDNV